MPLYLQWAYFLSMVLFIFGLKRMSSPLTASKGIVWAGGGMVLATAATFLWMLGGIANQDTNWLAIVLASAAIGGGGYIAYTSAKRVEMTDLPQMIALYNGMGGGSAACIAALALAHGVPGGEKYGSDVSMWLGMIGAVIGAVSFSGSLVAYGKLEGLDLFKKNFRFNGQQMVNAGVFIATIILGVVIALTGKDGSHWFVLLIFFAAALAFGVMMTLPIGGADMPVVISLYNAFTGLAVAFEGYVLGNPAMIVAGMIVGAAGTMLTLLMAKAMNRSVSNVLFAAFGDNEEAGEQEAMEGSMRPVDASDAAAQMAFAEKVIIVPGYGMAVAQAQHKIWEFCKLLQDNGVTVKFAIHPVAGRMPGHMNVLLAEAGVPYDIIYDLDEINAEFATADVGLVIGANDVVNPVAKSDPNSPIYGMPILDVEDCANVIVMKRGQGAGFSGVQNKLFFNDNTRMLYGDAQAMANELIAGAKTFLGSGH